MIRNRASLFASTILLLISSGCARNEMKPVDIFAEDNCANCRMAISDKHFASEIILQNGEVVKFDDLACLEQYRSKNPAIKIGAVFVSDYETGGWLPYDKSVIVRTGIQTPMGSGKIAVPDSNKAKTLEAKYPPAAGSVHQ